LAAKAPYLIASSINSFGSTIALVAAKKCHCRTTPALVVNVCVNQYHYPGVWFRQHESQLATNDS